MNYFRLEFSKGGETILGSIAADSFFIFKWENGEWKEFHHSFNKQSTFDIAMYLKKVGDVVVFSDEYIVKHPEQFT